MGLNQKFSSMLGQDKVLIQSANLVRLIWSVRSGPPISENPDKGRAGNGIRFDSTETMFIADYKGHNILRYNMIWVLYSNSFIT